MPLRIATLRQMAGLILAKRFNATATPMSNATIPPTVAEQWVQNSRRSSSLKINESTIISEPNVRILHLYESGSNACMILSSSIESYLKLTITSTRPGSKWASYRLQKLLVERTELVAHVRTVQPGKSPVENGWARFVGLVKFEWRSQHIMSSVSRLARVVMAHVSRSKILL